MSEKITRRVFLKATGLTALSIAAASALGGCSLSPLPGNVTLPSVDESAYQTVIGTPSYEIAFSSLSDQWESMSIYESDSKPHRYIYAGLYIRRATKKFTLSTSSIKCTIGGKAAKVAGLGNIAMNEGATSYKFPTKVDIAVGTLVGLPLYIDLGDSKLLDLTGTPIEITIKASDRTTITASYTTPSSTPSHTRTIK